MLHEFLSDDVLLALFLILFLSPLALLLFEPSFVCRLFGRDLTSGEEPTPTLGFLVSLEVRGRSDLIYSLLVRGLSHVLESPLLPYVPFKELVTCI